MASCKQKTRITRLPEKARGCVCNIHESPADVAITMDVGHFFYVHFKDDQAEFTKFADKFWMVRKLTLESLRPELIPAPVP